MSVLPSLYEYYTAGGITAGLSAVQNFFTLNEKNITIYSGSLHYFRVPQQYWRDRLRKMRAAGLNAVDTYVPWNLHEPEIGNYDFGNGGSDMQEFLHLEQFLKTAQEEDLLAIVRPGPYICAEFEFGGLPSWLLREKDQKVRKSVPSFMKHVTRYFNILLPILAALQFTLGGPIIAFQVENEYGATKLWPFFDTDKLYLEQLRQLNLNNGIVELLLTSDNAVLSGNAGSLPEHFLMTANFDNAPEQQFNRLNKLQPNKPSMAMEYWTGWFDHWGYGHQTRSSEHFQDVLNRILSYPASVNMYMFHGGTNWGFLNGALIYISIDSNYAYSPDTTSYDYDAPLTEAGDYTTKYYLAKYLINKYNKLPLRIPQLPAITPKVAYSSIPITQQLKFKQLETQLPYRFNYASPVSMETLSINNNSGQSYGYILYKKSNLHIPPFSVLQIKGYVYDTVMVVIDGVLVSKILTGKHDLNGFGYWRVKDSELTLGTAKRTNATLELIVENYGRNNFGVTPQFRQFKGLWQGDIYMNSQKLQNWEVLPLEFKSKWTNGLNKWQQPPDLSFIGPSLYKAIFLVNNPQDTFIDMRLWTKGIVIINGFILGRYATPLGPQQTLYLPAPLIRSGINEIVIFEHFVPGQQITFTDTPLYYTSSKMVAH